MSVTNGKQQSNEPFYRREFKQEQFLYEETSNLASEDSKITEPFQYFVIVFVVLLFAGCLVLLLLDLLLPRIREEQRRRSRTRLIQAMDQHSPILPRREPPRDDQYIQVPRHDSARDDLRRRRETLVNHQAREAPRGPPAFQFAFDNSTTEQELPDRPLGRKNNNASAPLDESHL